MSDGYLTLAAPVTAELRERGSHFLAEVRPVAGEAAAREALAAAAERHRDATHLCWAWRLGWPAAERASDAGEPHGTAGAPILRALETSGLSDVVALVARWFGGTKLGKGGLARAYGGVVREALAGAAVERRLNRQRLALTVPYDRLGAVQRLVHPPELEVVAERYGAAVELELLATPERRAALAALAAALGFPAPELVEESNGG